MVNAPKGEERGIQGPLEGKARVEYEVKKDVKNIHVYKFNGKDEGHVVEEWLAKLETYFFM